ncbi:MAG TPA: prephenate dehydrogenase/arogenate dehydrogenase family protein [Steroidobacteraceae bacterium]|nr:prephenate dehydrogenase/arogenate dehydrogenase family protein [Steroidobacteraceae bacterium]
MATTSLEQLRQQLDQLDGEIVALVGRRQAIAREVAAAKRATGYPTRDYEREREVIMGARRRAVEHGLSPDVAEKLLRLLIHSSLTTQEQVSVATRGAGGGRHALVIGGAGQMGGWFVGFLASQGFSVLVADPAGAPEGIGHVADWRELPDLNVFDYIVVATPLGASGAVLEELAARAPGGVVFDLGSLKSPLRQGLSALQHAGVKVTSLHPMFGPGVDTLCGRHVVFIDLGNSEALAAARALFQPTMAEQVVMELEEHDRLVAYVLGLSHALNIAFFTALAGSGEAAPKLERMSSTTFDAQIEVAGGVADENPELYYDIQALNDYGGESLQALAAAVDQLRQTVQQRDRAAFRRLMEQGQAYLKGRRMQARQRA